jgi:hypothetical protein
VLADVVDRDDVALARQPRSRQRLAREPRAQSIVLGVPLRQDLDRDRPPKRRVGRAIDVAHAALGDLLGAAVARREEIGVYGHVLRLDNPRCQGHGGGNA